MPKQFEVCTEEKVTRSYLVNADSAEEAREKFEAGDYVRESPSECIDCEVVDVIEVVQNEA